MRKYYLEKTSGVLLTLRTKGGKRKLTTTSQVELMYDDNDMPYFILKRDRDRRHKLGKVFTNILAGAAFVLFMLFMLHLYMTDDTGYYQEKTDTTDGVHYEWVNEDN